MPCVFGGGTTACENSPSSMAVLGKSGAQGGDRIAHAKGSGDISISNQLHEILSLMPANGLKIRSQQKRFGQKRPGQKTAWKKFGAGDVFTPLRMRVCLTRNSLGSGHTCVKCYRFIN
jgi:hypothetical protein